MKRIGFLLIGQLILLASVAQKPATIKETEQMFSTYPYSDPDPIPNPASPYYPYFRFDGFAVNPTNRQWKVIEMENDYIKVFIFPEIGGKIWGAIDKTNGNDFIYYNHVVKFRDIAMRGAWTSGGIEINFGIIGHEPTSATPVDYLTRTNEDGSVSCFLSTMDLITGAIWSVEVNLPQDKAYFTTSATWYNPGPVSIPYYHWMNAAYHAADDLELIFPGRHAIGHAGEVEIENLPFNSEGRNILWYKNNDYGDSKSRHIIGQLSDFYAAWWHSKDWGSVHYAPFDEKLGMKIWLWSLARDGAIWEDLLTDSDGQYVELQSGRMHSQAVLASGNTPFKLTAFNPLCTEQWTEYWFPVKSIRGIVKANQLGALNVLREEGWLKIYFYPTQKLSSSLEIFSGDNLIHAREIKADVFEVLKDSVPIDKISGKLKITIGHNDLVYSESDADNDLNRPYKAPAGFNKSSLYGIYIDGEQKMNYGYYNQAESSFKKCLEIDQFYPPALNKLAEIYYRSGKYPEALALCERSLSINTYDGEANYLFGLINLKRGRKVPAIGAFSVASLSIQFRSSSYALLSQAYMAEKNWEKAEHYAFKSLDFNDRNFNALQELMVIYRYSGKTSEAKSIIEDLLSDLPLNHYARYEKYLLNSNPRTKSEFTSLIRNELPAETYLEMARWYYSISCYNEALELLELAEGSPVAKYYTAYILNLQGGKEKSTDILKEANLMSPEFIFPYKFEDLEILAWAKKQAPYWKLNYYSALIYLHTGNQGKAEQLLDSCSSVDFAPFYLSRAMLKNSDEKLKDLLKAESINPDWRAGAALTDNYIGTGDNVNALLYSKEYFRKYPGNNYLGLKYAKALIANTRYKECVDLLKTITVLPTEGSYEGRDIYKRANLYLALNFIKEKRYAKALDAIKDSKLWPENLGVGKPYDDLIDYNLEDFMTALIYEKQGNNDNAIKYYEKIISYAEGDKIILNSDKCLILFAYSRSGKDEKAKEYIKNWLIKYPDSNVAKWCNALLKGRYDDANRILPMKEEIFKSAPWEEVINDYNFSLVFGLLLDLK
jgi:tetratricopeptide (TPR) repeat protein